MIGESRKRTGWYTVSGRGMDKMQESDYPSKENEEFRQNEGSDES